MTKVIAIEGRAWYSRVIEWFTWSPYSHVAIIVNGTAYEATMPKVRALSEAEFWEFYRDADALVLKFKRPLLPQEERELESELQKHVGDAYCERSLFRFVFRDSPDRPREDWVCSKYIFDCLSRIAIWLQERIPGFKISPAAVVMSPLLEVEKKVTAIKTPVKPLKTPHET